MKYKTYTITKITKGIIKSCIKFELNDDVKFSNGNYNFVFCSNEFPFKNYQRGDEIEVNLTNAKHMSSQSYHQGIIRKVSSDYVEGLHDDYGISQGSNSRVGTEEQIQGSITLSAYEMEAVYEFLYGALEWLELYIERAHPNWQQKKQLPKTITRPDIPYLDAKEIKEHFSTSLTGLRVITIDKPPFLLEKIQNEFFSWLDGSVVNVNDCPAELTQSLVDFHSILIGKGGDFAKRRRKETDENIAKMTAEERKKGFYEAVAAYQEPLENEDKVFEAMKGKTYKDVNTKSKFNGDANQGKEIFERIKKQREIPQQKTSSEIIQDVKNNRQDWRIDEVIIEYDNRGEATKKENALIHNSVEVGYDGAVSDWKQQIYLTKIFTSEEWTEINQILGISQISDAVQTNRSLIDEIKRNIHDFEFQTIVTFTGNYRDNIDKEQETMLVHKSVEITENDYKFGHLLVDTDKMFQENRFSQEEWVEIRSAWKVNDIKHRFRIWQMSFRDNPGYWEHWYIRNSIDARNGVSFDPENMYKAKDLTEAELKEVGYYNESKAKSQTISAPTFGNEKDKGIGTSGILTIIGLISVVVITGILLVRKKLNKKVKK